MESNKKMQSYTDLQETRKNSSNFSSCLTFSDDVIQKISMLLISEVNGVLGMEENFVDKISKAFTSGNSNLNGVLVEVGKTQAAIKFEVILEYGHPAPEIFKKVTNLIKKQVYHMTGLDVVKIDLHISDIMTHTEWCKKSGKMQN